MIEKEIFSKRLSEAINDRGIKQKVLAAQIGCTEGTISKYLNLTAKEMPNAGLLCKIAKELQVSVDWLLGLSDQKGIGDKLSLQAIGKILAFCVSKPQLNLKFASVSINEMCYDDREPGEPMGTSKENKYPCIFFSEWLDSEEAFTGNYLCGAGMLNEFIDSLRRIQELRDRLTDEQYKMLLDSELNKLSSNPL